VARQAAKIEDGLLASAEQVLGRHVPGRAENGAAGEREEGARLMAA
jgi:hypothetical protein